MYLKAIVDECCGGGPLDLTNCTEIDIALPNADGTFTHLVNGVNITSPSVLGLFSVLIDEETSALLNVGVNQTFNVTFTINEEVFTVPYTGALSVYQAV